MKDESERMGAPLAMDLDAWPTAEPPSDFADRVLAQALAEPPANTTESTRRTRRRWHAVAFAGAAGAALAAAVLLRISAPSANGEAIAKERTEVTIASRARAVLEPGADIRWNGDDVMQTRGDVFYRVEPGARFTVRTPAGDVEVKGTCFAVKVRPLGGSGGQEDDVSKRDLKSGAVGAALSALAFVAVYEGKVAVSHAGQRVDLAAGESAQTGQGGVNKSSTNAAGERSFEASAALAAAGDDPAALANQNLVRQVGEYRSRLEAIVAQKVELESKLKKSEERLAASQDGAAVRLRHDFDLSPDDWKELAKEGTIKFQLPCIRKEPWTPSPEKLNALGLAPQDAVTLKNAYARSNERVWAQLKPVCTRAMGSAEVAEKIGPEMCVHLVLDIERERDMAAAKEASKQVAEIRAGLRPMPGPNEAMHPVVQTFLAVTGEAKAFEADLAQSFGPEEAHRIVYADELCMGRSTFGGGPSR